MAQCLHVLHVGPCNIKTYFQRNTLYVTYINFLDYLLDIEEELLENLQESVLDKLAEIKDSIDTALSEA